MGSWQNTQAGELTHGLPESQRKASLIDIQKHTFPLRLLFFFCSLLCTDTQVCLRFLISRKSLKPSAQWNNKRRKIVEYPSPLPMAKLQSLATWPQQPKPINQISFSITNPVRGVQQLKESYIAEETAKRFWADRLESPAHVAVWHTPLLFFFPKSLESYSCSSVCQTFCWRCCAKGCTELHGALWTIWENVDEPKAAFP